MSLPDQPSLALLRHQADWLAPARARLLRRAGIAKRRRVLDLGCGPGVVTEELADRSGGSVVALDCCQTLLASHSKEVAGVSRICGRAERLPLADATFELVFCQFVLMWVDASAAIREVHRVLAPDGVFVAIEPDYGGMMEYPPEIATAGLWLSALARAGADPCIGRKLPGLFADAGFRVRVDLLDQLTPPSPTRFDLLDELPLSESERAALDTIRQKSASTGDRSVVHLPMFLVTGERT